MHGWKATAPAALLVWALSVFPPPALGADNTALGGIGGLDNGTLTGGDGSGEARISLFAVDLALVKQARDLSGTVLPDGAPVSPGQELYFVLYVDNPADVAAADLRITECKTCHHMLQPGDHVMKPCHDCHRHKATDPDPPKTKQALHTRCIGCHEYTVASGMQAGPGKKKCKLCHVK